MRGLDDLVRQGKILYAGISDAPAWWTAQANTLAELRGWTRFAAIQIEYNLIRRTVERDQIPVAKALNLGVTAWSPLEQGVLSGKYHGRNNAEVGRMSAPQMQEFLPKQERPQRIVSAVESVAKETERSMAQVALAWLGHRSVPVTPSLERESCRNSKTILQASICSCLTNR